MVTWTQSAGCRARVHCIACRTDAAWRDSLFKAGLTETPDFGCPHGITALSATAKPVDMMNLVELKLEIIRRLPCCGQTKDSS